MDNSAIDPIAHSGEPPDPYSRHVNAVLYGASERMEAMTSFAVKLPPCFKDAVKFAAKGHDLGKLDPENQANLKKGPKAKLPWDHIDAGVAYLSQGNENNLTAAWLVRGHHAPGLPSKPKHFVYGAKLRGRRHDSLRLSDHQTQIKRTDEHLDNLISEHHRFIAPVEPLSGKEIHGLDLRLALSCLVDADHQDTAFFSNSSVPGEPAQPRWEERLKALCDYVDELSQESTESKSERNAHRNRFFQDCLNSPINERMVACEGPVGLGKTTAVSAYLIKKAMEDGLRRLIIVAPYTNILTQTAKTLRKALVLPGENPNQIIVEHHHRADFSKPEDRDLAVLWNAPVVLTTSVSFFETLSSCHPGTLRKLHALPGSAIFLDESHAALPTELWRQNWVWLKKLCDRWSCRVVFASGSLAKFWQIEEIVQAQPALPELLDRDHAPSVQEAERSRISFTQLADGNVIQLDEVLNFIEQSDGPRLAIFNTVQNAAFAARALRARNADVMHISTALTPQDRGTILEKIIQRLKDKADNNWTLVATSCVEAGVDLSFRTAFRERFSLSSLLQIGGRVNRHGEYNSDGGSMVYDFAVKGEGIICHPAAKHSAPILNDMMKANLLNSCDPATLVTQAMSKEMRDTENADGNQLYDAEKRRDYPAVDKAGRVIDADTRLCVIDPDLALKIKKRQPVPFTDLLNGSVQIWFYKIKKLDLGDPISGRQEIYEWKFDYDPNFLGYMEGLLKNQDFLNQSVWII